MQKVRWAMTLVTSAYPANGADTPNRPSPYIPLPYVAASINKGILSAFRQP